MMMRGGTGVYAVSRPAMGSATRSGAHDEAELIMGGGGQHQQWLWLWHGGPVGRSQGVVMAPQGERSFVSLYDEHLRVGRWEKRPTESRSGSKMSEMPLQRKCSCSENLAPRKSARQGKH